MNLLFKSIDKEKEHTSLVFIVTPRLYRPDVTSESDIVSHEIHESHILPSNHASPDREHPGTNYRSDLRSTVDNTFNRYEPDAQSNLLHPDHPYNNPQALPVHGKDTTVSPNLPRVLPSEFAPTNGTKKNGGFFGKVFGSHKQNRGQ